jgi:hypothetical protein
VQALRTAIPKSRDSLHRTVVPLDTQAIRAELASSGLYLGQHPAY